jgi:hypothetical protein
MNPIPSRADGVKGTPRRRMIHRAATMVTTSMIGVSGFPRADAWDNPQRANSPKDEAHPEHEPEIEHSSFQNRHGSLLSLSTPPVVATLPLATRTTIGYEQNTSRMPRLRPL